MLTIKLNLFSLPIIILFCGCNDPPVVEPQTTKQVKVDLKLDSKVKVDANEFWFQQRKLAYSSLNNALGYQIPEETFWVYCKLVTAEIRYDIESIRIENDKITFEAMSDPEEPGNKLWHKGEIFTLHFDMAEMGMATRFEPGSFAYFGLTKDRQFFMFLYPAIPRVQEAK